MPNLNPQQRSQEAEPFNRTGIVIYVSRELGGGSKERVDIGNRVTDLLFTEGGKKANRLKLTIEDFALENSQKREFVRGGKIVVQWGYPGRLGPERRMVIQKVKGNHKLVVEGLARTVALHGEQKSRTFLQKKVSDIVKQILGENGWRPNEMDVEDTELTFDTVTQTRQTDAQFIRSLAAQEGFEWGDDFDSFRFKRAEYDKPPVREFRYYTATKAGDIIQFETEGNIAPIPTSISIKGKDPVTGQVIEGKGSNADTKRGGTAGTVTVRKIDNRSDAYDYKDRIGTAVKKPVADAKSAKRKADTAYINATRSSFKLKMVIVGDPQVVSRAVYQVSGIGQEESGRYYFNIIEHHIKGGKYTCKVEGKTDYGRGEPSKAKKAAAGAPPPGQVWSRKVVKDSNQQNALDRIQAKVARPERGTSGSR